MSEPRIITPEEARELGSKPLHITPREAADLAYTVATKPDRTRAAVVKMLRRAAELQSPPQTLRDWADGIEEGEPYDAIENGADMPEPHFCSDWHRRMYARLRATDKSHRACGQPWSQHDEAGRCPCAIENGEPYA